MQILYSHQQNPNKSELSIFFEDVFDELDDNEAFSEDQDQALDEWFSVDEMISYFEHGRLFEARFENNQLVGAIFIGKQNPISWPDGKKMEVFILGVDKNFRKMGVAKKLILLAEEYAFKQQAKKIIINTHVAMSSVHSIYQKIGYKKMGMLTNYYDNGDAVFFQKIL